LSYGGALLSIFGQERGAGQTAAAASVRTLWTLAKRPPMDSTETIRTPSSSGEVVKCFWARRPSG